jgi:hypothetical protein
MAHEPGQRPGQRQPAPTGARKWIAVVVMLLVVVALAGLATWAKARG